MQRENEGESPSEVTGASSKVFDRPDGLSFVSRNSHGHIPVRFSDAAVSNEHSHSLLPKVFRDSGGESVDYHRPVAVRVSSNTNPSLADELQKNLPASFAFNPYNFPVLVINGSNLFGGQTESLRVSNDRADVTGLHREEFSSWRNEESD